MLFCGEYLRDWFSLVWILFIIVVGLVFVWRILIVFLDSPVDSGSVHGISRENTPLLVVETGVEIIFFC